MEAPASRKLHAVMLAKLKNAVQKEALGRFEGKLDEFRTAGKVGDFHEVLNCIKACAGQQSSPWSPVQKKLFIECIGHAVIEIRNIATLPIHGTPQCLEQNFSIIPDFLLALNEGSGEKMPEIEGLALVVKRLCEAFESLSTMLDSEDYANQLPVLRKKRAALPELVPRMVEDDPDYKALAGSPFSKMLEDWLKSSEHDALKAQEALNMNLDHALQQKIDVVKAIGGGAKDGAHWWANCGNDVSLPTHFAETLGKLDPQQRCDASTNLSSALETYFIQRVDDADKTNLMATAHDGILRCRVTQLECVMFKTAAKSRKPADRLATAVSEFETEEQSDGKRKEVRAVLGPPVVAWCQATYGLFKADPK